MWENCLVFESMSSVYIPEINFKIIPAVHPSDSLTKVCTYLYTIKERLGILIEHVLCIFLKCI